MDEVIVFQVESRDQAEDRERRPAPAEHRRPENRSEDPRSWRGYDPEILGALEC